MLYGLLLTLFVLVCFALILLVLIQKGKGSMGLGSMGGGTTMLFGGSGGQDFFQKVTWALGAILMAGSLILGLMKSSSVHNVQYLSLKNPAEENTPAGAVLQKEAEAAAAQKSAETSSSTQPTANVPPMQAPVESKPQPTPHA